MNFAGWEPSAVVHEPHFGASHRRGGGSAQLDFVFTYSTHHWICPLAAVVQNKPTSMLPNGEEIYLSQGLQQLIGCRYAKRTFGVWRDPIQGR